MWTRRRQQPRATLTEAYGRPSRIRRAAYPRARGAMSWVARALLTGGSVGNLGSAPPLAVFGLASVFLYVLPAFVFLVPVSLFVAMALVLAVFIGPTLASPG